MSADPYPPLPPGWRAWPGPEWTFDSGRVRARVQRYDPRWTVRVDLTVTRIDRDPKAGPLSIGFNPTVHGWWECPEGTTPAQLPVVLAAAHEMVRVAADRLTDLMRVHETTLEALHVG
jgi:hypothetical protein